ncbi:MAG: hypothetical protein IJT16_02080 [Lachnospiraceae bacterium]|nr:hypothetical protein [Lachnospiraceae bacterium]MBQ9749471.1 hypothetical protein [Clostridia bacterium]
MKHLINRLTGGDMWVADNRVDKYLAAGHRLAAFTVKPAEATEEPDKTEETEKAEVAPVQQTAEGKTKRSRKAKE